MNRSLIRITFAKVDTTKDDVRLRGMWTLTFDDGNGEYDFILPPNALDTLSEEGTVLKCNYVPTDVIYHKDAMISFNYTDSDCENITYSIPYGEFLMMLLEGN